jgi:hypothetical protein
MKAEEDEEKKHALMRTDFEGKNKELPARHPTRRRYSQPSF